MTMRMRKMIIRDWWTFLVSPRGRINRFDYNVKFWLLLLFIYVVAAIVDMSYLGTSSLTEAQKGIATNLVNIVFLWPTIAIFIKRLHDLNWSGWWMLVIYGGLLIGLFTLFSFVLSVRLNGMILSVVFMFVVGVVPLVLLSCLRGTIGSNRFGLDPNDQHNLVIEGKIS